MVRYHAGDEIYSGPTVSFEAPTTTTVLPVLHYSLGTDVLVFVLWH